MASDLLPLITIFFALLLFPNSTFSAHAPQSSPSPSPQLAISPPSMAPNSPPSRPIPNSPSPAPFPRHEDGDYEESPSPAAEQGDLEESEGMSGGKKAGIAVGVIAAGCVVGMAAVVYKKRQRNIRRARYSYTDHTDFL
ncbi:classical arabinogalactan protein 1-like [Salvia hispanica]|uniref:classical arabinogalactan protein 1-like n=1 Tax=Salvia hispanica TaxID=49212 RepID=UPI00200966FA|nr:classical arabinogalactan protein 1-like [Salvia hispanica]